MKITFDIDCSPQEARVFLGLPDLTPIHDLYLDRMRMVFTEGIGRADLDKIMRLWMPGMSDGIESWQQAILNVLRPKSD